VSLQRNSHQLDGSFVFIMVEIKLMFGSFATGGGPITGHQYVALLEKYKPEIHWDEEFDEHLFIYENVKEKHVVFYPTLKSISIRLDEAKQARAGISIWEIGQGLEYFFDLL
jgi:chitinase domain-containing protein 1